MSPDSFLMGSGLFQGFWLRVNLGLIQHYFRTLPETRSEICLGTCLWSFFRLGEFGGVSDLFGTRTDLTLTLTLTLVYGKFRTHLEICSILAYYYYDFGTILETYYSLFLDLFSSQFQNHSSSRLIQRFAGVLVHFFFFF